ncbi:hypothetical protein [Tropicibacter naphthalenivorans]|uniref:Uncharacterized protein n=1 Tax=Tropicibacter naphthalenivorans TaxID=441103 RepID=A0A0P1GYF1_9RHOB|nr:hypothetical protein [Tropicibacter naphthalenivorans]CUH82358.1 hypothetical protein TRN7648_03929 [Tropicibacter naphthalenivorans]SMD05755.1 hypothetical protein SAMN04488093_11343 [Tropicibacter naphthalenivorans]
MPVGTLILKFEDSKPPAGLINSEVTKVEFEFNDDGANPPINPIRQPVDVTNVVKTQGSIAVTIADPGAVPASFTHVYLRFFTDDTPIMPSGPGRSALWIWLRAAEFKRLIRDELILWIGEGEGYHKAYDGLVHDGIGQNVAHSAPLEARVTINNGQLRDALIPEFIFDITAASGSKFMHGAKYSLHLTGGKPLLKPMGGALWQTQLACELHAMDLKRLLHSGGDPEIDIVSAQNAAGAGFGRKVQTLRYKLDLDLSAFTTDQLTGFCLDETSTEIAKPRWYVIKGDDPALQVELVPQKLMTFDKLKDASVGDTAEMKLYQLGRRGTRDDIQFPWQTAPGLGTGPNDARCYSGKCDVFFGMDSKEVSFSRITHFDTHYQYRIALDLGAGSHLMAFMRCDPVEQLEILDISCAPKANGYSQNSETSACLYAANSNNASFFYAGAGPFPYNAIQRRFPGAAQSLSNLTVLYGADPGRAETAQKNFASETVFDFKTRFFRGEDKIVIKGEAFAVLDAFQEICRKRFIEAILLLESGAGAPDLFPEPANPAAPVQMIVTHPGYVLPETYREMNEKLRNLQYMLAAQPPAMDYIQSVCTIPEPTALLRYLYKSAKVAQSDMKIEDMPVVSVLDCGYRTIDVATLSTGTPVQWHLTHAADLGGNVLDVSIAQALREMLRLSGKADLLDAVFNLDDETLAQGLAGALPDGVACRQRAGIEQLEKAKIALSKNIRTSGAKPPYSHMEFPVTVARNETQDDADNWFPAELINAIRTQGTVDLKAAPDGLMLSGISWGGIVETKALTAFTAQLEAFLSGLPLMENKQNYWIVTGRAARFPPFAQWIQDVAEKNGVIVYGEDDLAPLTGQTMPDPKEMVVRGALSLASELGSYNVELGCPACMFLIDSQRNNRIVQVHDIPSLTETPQELIRTQETFDRIQVCRCSLTVAEYIKAHQDDDPHAARRFMIDYLLDKPKDVGRYDHGQEVNIKAKAVSKHNGPTTLSDTITLFLSPAADGSMRESHFDFDIQRFGARPNT